MPGRKWYTGFRSRHPILTQKKAEFLTRSRRKITEESIRLWFANVTTQIGPDLDEILLDRTRVYNMDETCFYLNPDSNRIVLAEKRKNIFCVSEHSDKENITVNIAVNTAGERAPPLILGKFKRLPPVYKVKAPIGWSIGCTDNGWMAAKTFFEYIANVFFPFLKKKGAKFPITNFMDGHT